MNKINISDKRYEIINNPGAGNSMFWAVMMAYLSPEKVSQNDKKFKEKYCQVFKTEVGAELFYKNFQENTIQAKILVQLFRKNIAKSCKTWLPTWQKECKDVYLRNAFQKELSIIHNLEEYATAMEKDGTYGEKNTLAVIKNELRIRILVVLEKELEEAIRHKQPFVEEEKKVEGYFLGDKEEDIHNNLETITIVHNEKGEHYQYYGIKIPTVELTTQDHIEQAKFITQINVSAVAKEQLKVDFNLDKQSDDFAYNIRDENLTDWNVPHWNLIVQNLTSDEWTVLSETNPFEENNDFLVSQKEMLEDDNIKFSLFDGYPFPNLIDKKPPSPKPLQAPISTDMNWDLFDTTDNIPPTLSVATKMTFDEIRLVAVANNNDDETITNSIKKKQEKAFINLL